MDNTILTRIVRMEDGALRLMPAGGVRDRLYVGDRRLILGTQILDVVNPLRAADCLLSS